MTTCEVSLCKTIISDYFGDIVAMVANSLLYRAATFSKLRQEFRRKITRMQLKQSIIILLQHNIAKFAKPHLAIEYSICVQDILIFSRTSHCLSIAKKLFGETALAICREIASQGKLPYSKFAQNAALRRGVTIDEVKEIFEKLYGDRMIKRCEMTVGMKNGLPVFEPLLEKFVIPEINLNTETELYETERGTMKRKGSIDTAAASYSDSHIHWELNHIRFEQYMRDAFLFDLYPLNAEGDDICYKTLTAIVKVCEQQVSSSGAISFPIYDIVRSRFTKEAQLRLADIESAIKIFVSDGSCVFRKIGEGSGGVYEIDFNKVMTKQCLSRVHSLLKKRYGTLAVRIFNLLYRNGYLNEIQIEEMAMLTAKDAKSLCYQLMQTGFIKMKHFAKGNDFSASSAIRFFCVDLKDVVHHLYETTSFSLDNNIKRKRHETEQHKMLIDKSRKMDGIIANINADGNLDEETKLGQIDEVKSLFISAADQDKLKRYHSNINSLVAAGLELGKDLYLFSQFSKFF